MKYQIIEADSAELLEEKVNRWCNAGWVPTGGVSCSDSRVIGTSTKFYQAIVESLKPKP